MSVPSTAAPAASAPTAPALTGISPTQAELGQILHRLQRLIGSRRVYVAAATAAEVDLSQQAMQVLRVIVEHGASPAGDVARNARMDAGAVSRQLRDLGDRGLIERRPGPTRSTVVVAASRAGEAVVAAFEAARARQLTEALHGWSDEQQHQLAELMGRFVDDLAATPYRRG